MNYEKPSVIINRKDYDCVVSIGNKCPTAMTLRDLHLYGESFPFDYIPTKPALILKYLRDQSEFFPRRGHVRNGDGVWFGHFDTTGKYDETVQTFRRRFERLFEVLRNKKRILFVYTSEADVYNEMNNRYEDNYAHLQALVDYLRATYEYDDFTILAIHTNQTFPDTKNILNCQINVPNRFLSDDMRTHVPSVFNPYRAVLKKLIQEVVKA